MAAVLAFGCGAAAAEGPRLSLAVLNLDYDASETSRNGFVFNREQGRLRGLQLEASAHAIGARWTVQGQYLDGDPGYEGFNQIGVPLQTTTDLSLSSLEVQLAPATGWPLATATLRPWIGLMQRRIDRRIRPSRLSLALNEQLEQTLAQAGLQADAALVAGWSVQLQAAFDWPLRQRLTVDTVGVYDPLRLDPSERGSYELRLRLAYQLPAGWSVALQASYGEMRFGPSDARALTRNGTPIGVADYPGSRQRLSGGGLVLTQNW